MHAVRIIGGQWKRTPLPVLEAEGLRPTPDRVRETVFNWLNHLLGGTWETLACLDLFAGTGALGFEAASRGASRVLMVDANPSVVRQLEAVKTKLQAVQIEIVRNDALSTLKRLGMTGARFDVIFLDPPYHQGWLAKTLPQCERLLAEGGLLYVESEIPLSSDTGLDWISLWQVIRTDQAGMVFYHLLKCKKQVHFQA